MSGHPVERERVAARLVQCFDPGNRDFRICIADRLADGLYCGGRISRGANEDSPYMLRMLRGGGVYLVRRIAAKTELFNIADHPDYRPAALLAAMINNLANRIVFSPMPPRERHAHHSHQWSVFIVGALKSPSLQNRYTESLEVIRRHDPHRRRSAR